MTHSLNAAIVQSDLEPSFAGRLADALTAAGFSSIRRLDAFPPLEKAGEGRDMELHLPRALDECRFIVFDEAVDGRSAFELHLLLKATAEGKRAMTCMLVSSPSESTMMAGWLAGVDLFLSKPIDPAAFSRFATKIAESLRSAPDDEDRVAGA